MPINNQASAGFRGISRNAMNFDDVVNEIGDTLEA